MLVARFSSWGHDILQPTLYHSLLTQDPQEFKQMVMMAAG